MSTEGSLVGLFVEETSFEKQWVGLALYLVSGLGATLSLTSEDEGSMKHDVSKIQGPP